MAHSADWMAIDWGSTHVRAWGMSASGEIIATAMTDDGAGALVSEQFPTALARLCGDMALAEKAPVICCGMVGARQGWAEAPYRAAPCPPAGPDQAVRLSWAGHPVVLLPGLSQSAPPDVMRGEETQIAGVLHHMPDFDGVLCLPGTHSKWVHISAGEVVSFRSFMTGEMFALLSERSVLRHDLQGDGWDQAAFDAALDDSLSRPETLVSGLFGLRAGALLNGAAPAMARARLSGLLIGAELAAARPYWLGRRVGVVGTPALAQAYQHGLTQQGCPVEIIDPERAVLDGLRAAYNSLSGSLA